MSPVYLDLDALAKRFRSANATPSEKSPCRNESEPSSDRDDVPVVVSIRIELPERSPYPQAVKRKATLSAKLDNGSTCQVKLPVVFARRLRADSIALPCDRDRFFEELERLEQSSCTSTLLSVLERRDHSTMEARRKLEREGFLPGYVDASLDFAARRGFLDDARFALQFIEEKKRVGWGRRRIDLELRKRGIDTDADVPGYPDALFDSEDDYTRALHALSRKSIPRDRAFERLVRFLMGRGFDYATASRAVRQHLEKA